MSITVIINTPGHTFPRGRSSRPHTLLDRIIKTLRGSEDLDPQDAIRMAGFLFEKAAGLHGSAHTWDEPVREEPVDEADTVRLKQALLEFLLGLGLEDHALERSTLWALSKTWDRLLIPWFVRSMRRHIVGDPSALFQAMLGVHNHDEIVFGGKHSMGCYDIETNRRFARRYLARETKRRFWGRRRSRQLWRRYRNAPT